MKTPDVTRTGFREKENLISTLISEMRSSIIWKNFENITPAPSPAARENRPENKQPTVFIPVFPGTNCEYDSARAFERAGAKVVTRVLRNMSAEDIRQSVDEYRREIAKAQIVMFPGGFSAGDEPEGSAKFFATVFRNAVMKEEIEKLLGERDGLMLGICNGFQALIKLGLLPEGEIKEQGPESPTLAMNTIGRHVSKMVYTKVVSDKSPWLAGAGLGSVYCNPASHGEGRFVANESWLHRLFANGQVATQYVDDQGRCTMDEYWNPNGSYMQTLMDVGLTYIRLGQSATTLSGGEAQRVKLARELSKRGTGQTLYILDEPTTGLHFADIQQLLDVLHQLRDQGNTIVVIEHNLDVIKTADWIVDLGPEGGSGGGEILVSGTPETVAECEASHTARFLKPML